MTHQQTKERLLEEFYAFIKTLPSRVGETPESAIWDFISRAMDEAAHATEKAGEVEKQKHEKHADDKTWCGYCGHNAAIILSRRQLDEYFGRNV